MQINVNLVLWYIVFVVCSLKLGLYKLWASSKFCTKYGLQVRFVQTMGFKLGLYKIWASS